MRDYPGPDTTHNNLKPFANIHWTRPYPTRASKEMVAFEYH